MTGGYSWFPQFDGEIPGIFQTINGVFCAINTACHTRRRPAQTMGSFHKVKVTGGAGWHSAGCERTEGEEAKVVVYAREGYTAVKGAWEDLKSFGFLVFGSNLLSWTFSK